MKSSPTVTIFRAILAILIFLPAFFAAGAHGDAVTTNPLAPQLPAGVIQLKTYTLKDPGGTGLDAYTMLIPEGWTAAGGVSWDKERAAAPSDFHLNADSPRSVLRFAHWPSFLCVWSQTDERFKAQLGGKKNGCPILRAPDGPEAAIKNVIIPAYRSKIGNYKVIESENLPKLAAAAAPLYMGAGGMGTTRAARLRIEYTEDGQLIDQDIRCVMIEANGPSGVVWGLDDITTFRAPKGELDEAAKVMNIMALTLRPTPRFMDESDKVSKILVNMQAEDQAAIMQRARIMEEAQKKISDEMMQHWEDRMKTMDKVFEAYDSKAVRGAQDWTDPNTGDIIQIPDEYEYVWANGSTDYLGSTSSNFNPNGMYSGSWELMKKAN